jgi:hypothetical protein
MRRSESEAAKPPHMQKPSTIDIDPVIYLAIELSASLIFRSPAQLHN